MNSSSKTDPQNTNLLESDDDYTLEALFLGPRGENCDLLASLIQEGIRTVDETRKSYHPNDPIHITEGMKQSKSFQASKNKLREMYTEVLDKIEKSSVPFYSPRHQGHFAWDPSIPSLVGYIGALCHNPNSVTFEYSTMATAAEVNASIHISEMLGYAKFEHPKKKEYEGKEPEAWGHIPCDGTVANIEALWAMRNVKFFALSIQHALQNNPKLQKARDIKVNLLNGEQKPIVSLDSWTLLNLELDEVLDIPKRIYQQIKEEVTWKELKNALAKKTLRKLGMSRIFEELITDKSVKNPVYIGAATLHYSIPKAVGLLDFGEKGLLGVKCDEDARMDMEDLRKILNNCLEKKIPVINVISIFGTTEGGAVDPLNEILKIREEFRKKGLDFFIHADGAFGGYAACLKMGKDGKLPMKVGKIKFPTIPTSQYVQEQIHNLKNADSITIDPHKQGYCPYPAGGIFYRNANLKYVIRHKGSYISMQTGPQMGVFGIEGSKSGSSAIAVDLAHRVLPLTLNGHGMIMAMDMYGVKRFFARLLDFKRKTNNMFEAFPLARFPSEKMNKSQQEIDQEKEFIYQNMSIVPEDEFNIKLQDPKINKLFNEMGPDLNVITWSLNFHDEKTGKMNTSLKLFNKLNLEVFSRLTPRDETNVKLCPLMLTHTILEKKKLGPKWFNEMLRRNQLEDDCNEKWPKLIFLRSGIMNPWLSQTSGGTFLDIIEDELLKVAQSVLQDRLKWENQAEEEDD